MKRKAGEDLVKEQETLNTGLPSAEFSIQDALTSQSQQTKVTRGSYDPGYQHPFPLIVHPPPSPRVSPTAYCTTAVFTRCCGSRARRRYKAMPSCSACTCCPASRRCGWTGHSSRTAPSWWKTKRYAPQPRRLNPKPVRRSQAPGSLSVQPRAGCAPLVTGRCELNGIRIWCQ